LSKIDDYMKKKFFAILMSNELFVASIRYKKQQ
jgi:hypothetical protein